MAETNYGSQTEPKEEAPKEEKPVDVKPIQYNTRGNHGSGEGTVI